MRRLTLIAFFLVAACAPPVVHDVSYYRQQGEGHILNIDDYRIHVLPQEFGNYVAWGGERGKDGRFVKYRQRRAIEIYTKCRVDQVYSTPKDTVFYASVACR